MQDLSLLVLSITILTWYTLGFLNFFLIYKYLSGFTFLSKVITFILVILLGPFSVKDKSIKLRHLACAVIILTLMMYLLTLSDVLIPILKN